MASKKAGDVEVITIRPPKFRILEVSIQGTSPYMQNKFSAKAREMMRQKMLAGQQAKGKKVREARDFDADFIGAQHVSEDGWLGIPAPAFRCAMIDVCRMVGYKMTMMKMSTFVEMDGIDIVDGTPLVKIDGPAPEKCEMMVRVGNGLPDIRVRPMWRQWGANLRIKFDEDQFKAGDVVNLLARAGQQVGIGEGRPFSKNSAGLGFGLFEVASIK